jgi:Uma2 family endonuclease
MALLLCEPSEVVGAEPVRHKTWTRSEIAVLEGMELFEGTHFELIEGELVYKMGKNLPHVRGVKRSARGLELVFGEEFVYQEAPIDVAEADNPRNEPEPDVVVMRRRGDVFTSNPTPADLELVMEVADTTLRMDQSTKAKLYARAGIPEYWLLDLNGRRLLVFRDPEGGEYKTRIEFDEHQSVCPLARPSHAVAVASLLP